MEKWIEIMQLQDAESIGVRLVLAFASLLVAFSAAAYVRRMHVPEKITKNTSLEARIITFFVPLLTPALTLVFLLVASYFVKYVYGSLVIIPVLAQLALIWLLVRMVHLLTGSVVAKWFVGVVAIPVVVLNFLGLYEPLVMFLDGYAFRSGNFSISAFQLIKFIVTLVVLLWIAGGLSRLLERTFRKSKSVKANTRQILVKFSQIIIYFIVFLVALDSLGFDLTTFAVLGGAIGVGIGIGLQKIASNFISGLILLFEKSVEIEDLIELENGIYGFVRETGARYTLVETFDGKEIMVPNEDFITHRVTNWTYSNKRGRVEIQLGVSYDSDIEKAQELILEAAKEHPRCIEDPSPVCYLREFADSSVNFLLFFWVSDVTEGRFEPQSDVMFSIWRKFKEHGIQIPFPQRDIHIKTGSLPAAEVKTVKKKKT